jgi:hypothetical protein
MDLEEEKKITQDLDLVSISKIIRENNRIRRNKLKRQAKLINHQNDQNDLENNEIYNFDHVFFKNDKISNSHEKSLDNQNRRSDNFSKRISNDRSNNSILFNTHKSKKDQLLVRSSTVDNFVKYPKNEKKNSVKDRKYQQISWFIFLIMSTSLCSYMIVKTLIDFSGYEVITKIRVFNDKVNFMSK